MSIRATPWDRDIMFIMTTSRMAETYWSLHDLAAFLGVEYTSARTYHGRSEINRKHAESPVSRCRTCREGGHQPRSGDLPPPDKRFGRSPVWYPETIRRWQEQRPGRGVGGGRPMQVK